MQLGRDGSVPSKWTQVIPKSRSPAQAKCPPPKPSVGPSSGIKMLFFALLLTFFLEATTSEVYEDAMNRQIEDDVLRKFYIDMSPGHTIYESQSVGCLNLLNIKTKMHRVSTLRTTLTTTLRQSPRNHRIMELTSRASRPSRSRKFSRFSSFFRISGILQTQLRSGCIQPIWPARVWQQTVPTKTASNTAASGNYPRNILIMALQISYDHM